MADALFALHDWAVMLECGMPVLVALEAACGCATEEDTRVGLRTLHSAIAEGQPIGEVMQRFPLLFPAELAKAFAGQNCECEGCECEAGSMDDGGQELAPLIVRTVLAKAGRSEAEFVLAKNTARGRTLYQPALLAALAERRSPSEALATVSAKPDAVVTALIQASADCDSAIRALELLVSSQHHSTYRSDRVAADASLT